MAIITTSTSSSETIAALHEIIPEYLHELSDFSSADTYRLGLIKVFVNGFWTGFILKSEIKQAVAKLRTFRREHPE